MGGCSLGCQWEFFYSAVVDEVFLLPRVHQRNKTITVLFQKAKKILRKQMREMKQMEQIVFLQKSYNSP